MKTLGRILIILAVMAIVMGVTYAAVNSGGSASAAPQFEAGRRPPFREGQFDGDRHEGREGGGGWMFGLIKNVGVIAVVVTLIVLPKSVARKRRRTVAAS
ncbi:MAG: hypothetical protein HXY42_02630 [Chloroflexi bacterium]|nr:hypothetical protein [Chloroflexota bacterium]